MSRYAYRAKAGPGRTVEGEVEADSQAAAIHAVDRMGYSPISVEEKSAAAERGVSVLRGISRRDVTVFTRQLSSLIRSGVPILRALLTTAEQTENPRLRRVVTDLESTIRDGQMLSAALARHSRLFPPLYVNMVKAGEASGTLELVLARLAEARERDEELRRRVQSATAYPLLILAVGVITVFVLLSFFLPKVVSLFRDYTQLPLPTRILMATSDFFHNNWYWMVIAVALLAAVVKRLAAVEKGRMLLDQLRFKLPLIGTTLVQGEIARFARTLSMLLQAGVPVDRGLLLAAETLGSVLLREELLRVRQGTVQQGVPLSVGLKKSVFFPPLVSNMVAVGEEAGRLEEALDEVATYYEKDVEQRVRMATSLLEPVLILVVGAVVGLIVAAMLLPIFKLSTSFGG